jgi:hypothetical protein
MDIEKLLYGSAALHRIEMDDEDSEHAQLEAEKDYDFYTFIDSIGTDEFKETYFNFIDMIIKTPLHDQQMLASSIIQKIEEQYKYEFMPTLDLITVDQINRVYDLISFIEFNYEEFVYRVYKKMNIDISKINVQEFCKSNSKRVTNAIDKVATEIQFGTISDGMLTKIFLRTYYKDGLIEMFIRMSNADKSMIVLKMMEGEINGKPSASTSSKEDNISSDNKG